MRHFKIINNGYILAIGVGTNGAVISIDEYNNILDVINSCPSAPDGYSYRLTVDLQWELYELPIEETDEPIENEISEIKEKAQAYDIIMGVSK